MKIVLEDDQTLIHKGLISILSSQKTMEISGEARGKQEALTLIQRENPDLVIVSFHLGKESGLEVITEARKRGCTCKFIILIYSKDLLTFQHATVMDVEGYISLEAHPE